jgi:hypothetical protein
MSSSKKLDLSQLESPTRTAGRPSPRSSAASPAPTPTIRILPGQGQKRPEPLTSREAVIRLLIEAGADLLLRRISSQRAEEIRLRVDQLLGLFDRVDRSPQLVPALRHRLDELEAFMRETRSIRTRRAK